VKNTTVVSFPRCGRTYLRNLVNQYCHPGNPKPDYSEEPDWVTFNHDFFLDAPILLDYQYVILTRDPYRSLESYRALPASKHPKRWYKTKEEAFMNWSDMYFKWVLPAPNDFPVPRLIIPYEDLITNTELSLGRFLEFAGAEVNQPWLKQVVERNPARPRSITEVAKAQTDTPW